MEEKETLSMYPLWIPDDLFPRKTASVIELEAGIYRITPEEMRQWFEGEGVFEERTWVICSGEKIIGAARIAVHDIYGSANEIVLQIDGLVVSPDYRRKGIGSVVLSIALEDAFLSLEGKCRVVGITVSAEEKEGAGFYRVFFEKFFPGKRVDEYSFPVWSHDTMVKFMVYV